MTHRHKEQHAGDHGRERRAAHLARVDVPEQPDGERTDGGDDVGAVEDEVVRDLVRRVRHARDDDHDDELDRPERLQVRERGHDRERRHDDELRPPRERLQVPRERRRPVAPVDDVLLHERCAAHERERAFERRAMVDVRERPVVRDEGASDGRGRHHPGCQCSQILACTLVEEQVQV